MPKVIIWREGAIETEFDPGHRDWRLGRSETNDITLLDPRKSVSRFHAELREENGRWVFIDLSSQNGSWKDGQRVNRLVLEHGHEVLFGDYKLSFEDPRAAPAPVPSPTPTADATANVGADTSTPIAPEQTLPVPPRGRSLAAPEPTPAPVPAAAPVPVPASGPAPIPVPVPGGPVANRAVPPRKGVNPAIIVLLLIALLGGLAAAAWKFLSSRTVEPRVVQSEAAVEPVPAAPNDPAPAEPAQAAPAATRPVTDPEPTPPATTSPVAEATPPAEVAPAPAPDPATAPGTAAPAAPAKKSAAATPSQTKRPPETAAPDNTVVVSRYEAGRRALAAGRFAEAERAFQAVLSRQPGFRDTAALLQRARAGQAAARDKALEEAAAFAAKGEWARAIAAYERVGASEEAQTARTQMAAAGEDAYRKARQFDARNRLSDAITWYQRAVTWLPESDARKALAQERLAVLKGGGE